MNSIETEQITWKDRLYRSYISSGQAKAASSEPAQFFGPRAAYVKQVIRRHFPPNRSSRILDLGCGHGTFLYFLKRAGYQNIFGVDVSPEQIEQARSLGISEAVEGHLEPFLAQTPSASVDAVIAFDILEHLDRGQLFSTLEGIHRVLNSSGRCILHVPNAEGIAGMRIRYGDLTHESAFTANSLRQLARATGFSRLGVFEDKPCVHGTISAARRLIWEVGTAPFRILLMAETGERNLVLSQNLLAIVYK